MDGVNAREREKTINLMGVNRPSRKCECVAIAPTVLCINRLHNINAVLYSVSMFSLKAPLFKGGWGGSADRYNIS